METVETPLDPPLYELGKSLWFTITSSAIRIEPVSNSAVANVGPNGVVANLSTGVSSKSTFIDV